VDDSAAGQGEIRLHPVQLPLGGRKRTGITSEDGALVEQPRAFDPIVRAHHRLPSSHKAHRFTSRPRGRPGITIYRPQSTQKSNVPFTTVTDITLI
jgi:hypothetical protein